MENSFADPLDRESDYGSDFTADEEVLLNQLLQKLPPTLKPDPDLDTLRGDLENNENIHHTTFSHTTNQGARDKGGATAWKVAANKTRTSISLEGYGSTFTARRLRILWSGATN